MKLQKFLCGALLATAMLLSPVWAEPQSLYEGALKLDVPSVFQSLPEESIEAMFSTSAHRPQVVYATPDAETRVALTYLSTPFTAEDVEPTRVELTSSMEQKAEVAWHRNEVVVLNDRAWFRMDYDLSAKQPPTREILLGTSLRGKLLFVMIATPATDLELLGSDLEALIASLQGSES